MAKCNTFYKEKTKPPYEKWTIDGIPKRISFHRFRDTSCTLQFAAGTDFYTVGKLLDHTNVTTS